jgi:DNA repair protein RadC
MKSKIKVRQHRSAARPSPQVKTPAEFKVVRLRECPVDSPIIENPPQAVGFWREHVITAPWFKEDKESLCVFLLNTRHRLLGFELVSQGTLDTILFHPREVLRLATTKNAAGIFIAHNHPSGDPLPSEADVKATRDLILAAEHLKIELVDHVIIGDARLEKGYASLRELGYFYADDPAQTRTRKDSKDVRGAAEEINLAASQSNVLLELIENHLDYREHRGDEDFTGERADRFNLGLSFLVRHTSERLEKAAANIMSAASSKKRKVAS